MFFHGLVSEPFVDPDDDFEVPAWCPFALNRSREGISARPRITFLDVVMLTFVALVTTATDTTVTAFFITLVARPVILL